MDQVELEQVNTAAATKPCEGLLVVEVAAGTSDLGLGLAAGVPGMILGHLGARVQRVVGSCSPGIDEGVRWGARLASGQGDGRLRRP